MSLFLVVAVRDRALDAYMNPFVMNTFAQAERVFADEVRRVAPDNNMNRHPEDYDLYHLGTFDSSTGVLEPLALPVVLARAQDLITS